MGDRLPSGTVTMLFSDIEASTALLSRLGDRYTQALDVHRSLLRSAWTDWGGREMGTEGDSFFVVFDVAWQAANAALQGQQALARHDWEGSAPLRARIGVHTGSPLLHGGDYVGMDVHRAARIAGAAHGGQVVASDVTARLATDRLPDGAGWLDLGSHRLKDLSLPERLFQLSGPGLDDSFPPLRALGTASSLPVPATGMFGRAGELAELAALITGRVRRLVTLSGPGGAGKTRLAVGVAKQVEGAFPDGVYFVPLAAATTTEAMWAGIGETLGVPVEQRAPPQLFGHVGQRATLVVLDNLEQVPTADAVVAELLNHASNISIVATSRRPLHLGGEHEHPVPPLQLPRGPSLTEAQQSGAVQMFVEHVGLVRRGFALSADNAADVMEICRRLDGLPLALELAAARTRLLSPRALLGRLDAALELRAPSTVDRPARQYTLRDTIAWSHQLLEPDRQAFFRRLSVFAGGADLDAVSALTADLLPAGGDPLDPIADLLDASLITVTDTLDGEPRIGMLQTIRSYAIEQLDANGESERARDRHADHFQSFAQQLGDRLDGPQVLSARSQLDLELDNIRATLTHRLRILENGDRRPDQINAALRAANACTSVIARGSSYWEQRRWLERTLELTGDAGPSVELAWCLSRLAFALIFAEDPVGARDIATRALVAARATHDPPAQTEAIMMLGLAHSDLGDLDGARSLLEQAVSLARSSARRGQLNDALVNLAYLEDQDHNFERAVELLEEARAEADKRSSLYEVAFIDVFVAALRWEHEGSDAARRRVLSLTGTVLQFRDHQMMLIQAGSCVRLLADSHQRQVAAYIGAADAERERIGVPRTATELQLEKDLQASGATTESEDWKTYYQLGRTKAFEEALTDLLQAAQEAGDTG